MNGIEHLESSWGNSLWVDHFPMVGKGCRKERSSSCKLTLEKRPKSVGKLCLPSLLVLLLLGLETVPDPLSDVSCCTLTD